MAKRKCRMTEREVEIHKQAVALRKMTDEQLVNAFDEADGKRAKSTWPTVLMAKALNDEEKKALIKAHEENTEPLVLENGKSVDTLLNDLKSNKVKGVGKVTAEKIIDYCIERGYSKYGIYEMG